MASIRKEIALSACAESAWDALRDFHHVHLRVAPGFLTACEPDGAARIVTFFNGTKAREVLVTSDDLARRLVYSAQSERIAHHNASVEIVDEGMGRVRFVWTADVLPDTIAPHIESQMEIALPAIRKALESA